MVDGIRHCCETFRERTAGSKAEADCQDYFLGELGRWSDAVQKEAFALHPKAFLGWMATSACLDITAVALFWARAWSSSIVLPIIAMLASTCTMCLFVFEFLLYRRFVDPFFPKAVSHNIYAVRKSVREPKRRIVFCGHADAAYEMGVFGHKPVSTVGMVAGAIIGSVFVFVVGLVVLVTTCVNGPLPFTGAWIVIGILEILCVPFFIAKILFVNWNYIVDGANDNLSACYVALNVLRTLDQQGIRYAHTEVGCLITGGEEAGLRGALAFAKTHRLEFEAVETIFITMDTLREIEHLQVYTLGQNATQKNDAAVARLLIKAADSCGQPLPIAKPYFGAVDAEAFSRYKLRACGLCGINHDPQPYYHTRQDTWTNINAACMDLTLQICLEAAARYDRAGLDN